MDLVAATMDEAWVIEGDLSASTTGGGGGGADNASVVMLNKYLIKESRHCQVNYRKTKQCAAADVGRKSERDRR